MVDAVWNLEHLGLSMEPLRLQPPSRATERHSCRLPLGIRHTHWSSFTRFAPTAPPIRRSVTMESQAFPFRVFQNLTSTRSRPLMRLPRPTVVGSSSWGRPLVDGSLGGSRPTDISTQYSAI